MKIEFYITEWFCWCSWSIIPSCKLKWMFISIGNQNRNGSWETGQSASSPVEWFIQTEMMEGTGIIPTVSNTTSMYSRVFFEQKLYGYTQSLVLPGTHNQLMQVSQETTGWEISRLQEVSTENWCNPKGYEQDNSVKQFKMFQLND